MRSNVVNWAQFPMNTHKKRQTKRCCLFFSRNSTRQTNQLHPANVRDDYVQHRVLIIELNGRLLSEVDEYDFHVNLTFVNSSNKRKTNKV